MIHGLQGVVSEKSDNWVSINVKGVIYKVFASNRTISSAPEEGEEIKLFTHLAVKEDALDLFGFLNAEELHFFELLISVSGVGPRSALAVLETGDLQSLTAAIKENRPDLLTRAAGIGQKTAERIIIELRNKVKSVESESTVKRMEGDSDLLETLVGLGYRKEAVRSALSKIPLEVSQFEARLKEALRILNQK